MIHLKNLFLGLSLLVVLTVAIGCGGSPAKGSNASSGSNGSNGSNGQPLSTNGITVTSPSNGASVGATFQLAASATDCSSQPVTSFGYSIDNSTSPSVVNGNSISTQVAAPAGTHVLHVKAWGNLGASCGADVMVAVTNSSSPEQSVVPANAIVASNLQNSGSWQANHDPATGATSSGAMSMVSSPSLSGNARQFDTSFANSGGEIYYLGFGNDPAPKNFFYDAWVYLTSSAGNMENLEMDMNQVLSNGQTVVYGFQCDGLSNTWDYTQNTGTISKPNDSWIHSNASCNVANWAKNAWHHVQISYSRDDAGDVTYHSVWLDGAESKLEVTVPSSFALGWTPTLLTNFQIDGNGSGSNTVFLDKLTISRW